MDFLRANVYYYDLIIIVVIIYWASEWKKRICSFHIATQCVRLRTLRSWIFLMMGNERKMKKRNAHRYSRVEWHTNHLLLLLLLFVTSPSFTNDNGLEMTIKCLQFDWFSLANSTKFDSSIRFKLISFCFVLTRRNETTTTIIVDNWTKQIDIASLSETTFDVAWQQMNAIQSVCVSVHVSVVSIWHNWVRQRSSERHLNRALT